MITTDLSRPLTKFSAHFYFCRLFCSYAGRLKCPWNLLIFSFLINIEVLKSVPLIYLNWAVPILQLTCTVNIHTTVDNLMLPFILFNSYIDLGSILKRKKFIFCRMPFYLSLVCLVFIGLKIANIESLRLDDHNEKNPLIKWSGFRRLSWQIIINSIDCRLPGNGVLFRTVYHRKDTRYSISSPWSVCSEYQS